MDLIVDPEAELAIVVTNADVHRLAGGEADLGAVIAGRDLGTLGDAVTSTIVPSSVTV